MNVSYENEEYQEGELSPNNCSTNIGFLFLQLGNMFKLIIMLICEPFIAIWLFLFPAKTANGKNISGQVALVTGSANGLGRAIAFRLAQENCNIAVADINYKSAVRTANEIKEKFRVKAEAYKVDVADPESIRQLKVDIEASLGAVDILVNNAGMLTNASFREYTDHQLQKIIDVNFTSHFFTVRAFLDGMIERKRGRIVAISSVSAKMSMPLGTVYSTTKTAVQRFMECLHEELYCYGHQNYVHLSTVFPGFIATRKELTNLLDDAPEFHRRLTVKKVANAVVKGMLRNQRDITVPAYLDSMARTLDKLPFRVKMVFKTEVVPLDALDNHKKKLEQIKLKNFGKVENELERVHVV